MVQNYSYKTNQKRSDTISWVVHQQAKCYGHRRLTTFYV